MRRSTTLRTVRAARRGAETSTETYEEEKEAKVRAYMFAKAWDEDGWHLVKMFQTFKKLMRSELKVNFQGAQTERAAYLFRYFPEVLRDIALREWENVVASYQIDALTCTLEDWRKAIPVWSARMSEVDDPYATQVKYLRTKRSPKGTIDFMEWYHKIEYINDVMVDWSLEEQMKKHSHGLETDPTALGTWGRLQWEEIRDILEDCSAYDRGFRLSGLHRSPEEKKAEVIDWSRERNRLEQDQQVGQRRRIARAATAAGRSKGRVPYGRAPNRFGQRAGTNYYQSNHTTQRGQGTAQRVPSAQYTTTRSPAIKLTDGTKRKVSFHTLTVIDPFTSWVEIIPVLNKTGPHMRDSLEREWYDDILEWIEYYMIKDQSSTING